jgi:hypothetical protein
MMKATYVGALVIAGIFTFLPGRIMNDVLFGGPHPLAGVALVAAMAAGGAVLIWRRPRGTSRGGRLAASGD